MCGARGWPAVRVRCLQRHVSEHPRPLHTSRSRVCGLRCVCLTAEEWRLYEELCAHKHLEAKALPAPVPLTPSLLGEDAFRWLSERARTLDVHADAALPEPSFAGNGFAVRARPLRASGGPLGFELVGVCAEVPQCGVQDLRDLLHMHVRLAGAQASTTHSHTHTHTPALLRPPRLLQHFREESTRLANAHTEVCTVEQASQLLVRVAQLQAHRDTSIAHASETLSRAPTQPTPPMPAHCVCPHALKLFTRMQVSS